MVHPISILLGVGRKALYATVMLTTVRLQLPLYMMTLSVGP